MTIQSVVIDVEHAGQLFDAPTFENVLLGSWEQVSLTTQFVTRDLLERIKRDEPEWRAYHSWELIAISLETVEMVGNVLLHHERGGGRALHEATNPELAELFERYERPLPPDAVQTFLRLPTPKDSLDTVVGACFRTALDSGARALNVLASHWRRFAEAVRWFRHFPAHLTLDDVDAIDPGPNASKDAIFQEIAAMDDLLDVAVVPDGQGFGYQAIREPDVQFAARMTYLAIEVVLTRGGNLFLNPESDVPAERYPKLYPFLVRRLSPENRSRLAAGGPYHLI